jgi:autotransporter-associated beta strand protein
MRLRAMLAAIALSLASGVSPAYAVLSSTKFWDLDGDTPGAGSLGGFADGVWNTQTSNWNRDPSGGGLGAELWADGDNAVFSAGSDALDSIISIPAPRTVSSLTIEEGLVHFVGASEGITLGTNPIYVHQGAILSYAHQNIIKVNSGQVMTLDGGTVRNTINSLAASFYGPNATTQILLTSNGGTVNIPNGNNDDPNGSYSLLVYGTSAQPSVIGMTPGTTAATLHKTGHGEFRAGSNWTFTTLDVDEGLYRINNTGGSETGFGSPSGTVTTHGGAVENTSNGSGLATNIALASPATRSFVLGGASDTMFSLAAPWTINGPISGDGGLMLNGWVRNDVGIVLGAEAQTLKLTGTNTYAGTTTICYGTLAANGGAAIPDGSRVFISDRSSWGGNIDTERQPVVINSATLRIETSETIGSLSGGSPARGNVSLEGGVTLTLGADNTDASYFGGFSGGGNLKKIGDGTQALTGANIAYTGNTLVEAGALSLANPVLADGANVLLSGGSKLNLAFQPIDTIHSLFFNGQIQPRGTWGGPGSGAQFTSSYFSGSGRLNVTDGPVIPEPACVGLMMLGLGCTAGIRRRAIGSLA